MKLTNLYLSELEVGKLLFCRCSTQDKNVLVGQRATKDVAESSFSSFTEKLKYTMIDFHAATSVRNLHQNGYMNQPLTSKERKEKESGYDVPIIG